MAGLDFLSMFNCQDIENFWQPYLIGGQSKFFTDVNAMGNYQVMGIN